MLLRVADVALIVAHDGFDATTLGDVGVILSPVTVVLGYLEKS